MRGLTILFVHCANDCCLACDLVEYKTLTEKSGSSVQLFSKSVVMKVSQGLVCLCVILLQVVIKPVIVK